MFCVFAKINLLNTNKEYDYAEMFLGAQKYFCFLSGYNLPTQNDRTGFMSEGLLDEIT